MALIIQQQFPLGRFHATRWNQGAFGDAYGEWPPSPWRLLRALAPGSLAHVGRLYWRIHLKTLGFCCLE